MRKRSLLMLTKNKYKIISYYSLLHIFTPLRLFMLLWITYRNPPSPHQNSLFIIKFKHKFKHISNSGRQDEEEDGIANQKPSKQKQDYEDE